MAAIKQKKSLAALTCAALGLPGISANAAIPAETAKGNVQYNHYKEAGDRIEAQVFHTDLVIPFADRFEFTFSLDQDIYSGATPVYSTAISTPDIISAATGITDPWTMMSPVFNAGASTPIDVLRSALTNQFITDKVDQFGLGWLANPANLAAMNQEIDIALARSIISPSPTNAQPRQVFAFQPRETRTMPIFGGNYYWDDVTLGLTGGFSDEPDWFSGFGSTNVNWEFNNKLTTLSAAYGLTHNTIGRNAPLIGVGGHLHGGGGGEDDFRQSSTFHGFNLGLSHIFTKNTVASVNGGYTNQRGFLTNPYKLVYIRGEITPEEYARLGPGLGNIRGYVFPVDWSFATDLEVMGIDIFREVRPSQRHQWTLATNLNQYIPAFDASLHFDYRFYTDSWGIDSHTFEANWYQPVGSGWMINPTIRYYSQSQAEFFAPFFLAPRADGFYTSDYRLSGFGKLSGGLTVSKQFTKGIRLQAGFEYITHQGALKLGGGGEDAYADIDSYLAHAAVSVDLSDLGRGGSGDHDGHHMDHHDHTQLPAGVFCFGHMLDQIDQFMVGYMYMYMDQAGGMRRGSKPASDNAIKDKGCPGGQCSAKINEMVMHMHMLDIMYAPTDWLNFMLMPQLINMSMTTSLLPGAPIGAHGAPHVSDGLGDTIVMAMFKLFETEGHRFNMGVGLSAPTGDVEVTMNGSDDPDSILQDFGMQLGSGTWDFIPTLTYIGHLDDWSWGAQVNGTVRMEKENKMGYRLGDNIQGSVWGGYNFLNWLSATVRGVYTVEGSITGEMNRPNAQSAPVDFPNNFGGRFWDLGLGVSAMIPDGRFSGHSLSVEWLQPVSDYYNGYQLERAGALTATWSYMF